MPTYDYRCDANGQVVEVSHRMSESLATWGELCAQAQIPCGDTPENTPVYRMANGGNLISSNSLGSGMAPAPACGTGGCCPSGMCGLN
ncbi:FmdB family zinc ribbon protein [Thiorhodovibrio frisius]|uniref:Zinc ribbon domain-containing protein n=1 Tax=Thiorhodovibrio frisius TaxID=631362 RepID=H8Z8E6_9GAMM|nr:hypothetical protein [Thiorhodovibrio frisius]EIC19351.1 hypothetical protein Thi970DRAFT_04868 [Thiorhodovibrio frisius]WPL22350.1 putative regulatory protein, FmdB family [Thiorhodovibrio frisius]